MWNVEHLLLGIGLLLGKEENRKVHTRATGIYGFKESTMHKMFHHDIDKWMKYILSCRWVHIWHIHFEKSSYWRCASKYSLISLLGKKWMLSGYFLLPLDICRLSSLSTPVCPRLARPMRRRKKANRRTVGRDAIGSISGKIGEGMITMKFLWATGAKM